MECINKQSIHNREFTKGQEEFKEMVKVLIHQGYVIKTTLRFHLTQIRMVKLKTQVIAPVGENMNEEEDSPIAGRITPNQSLNQS